jgi:exopolyphosphatase/guanosine-5'-triphosphate,3'-diphosphate pyrophosphatase
MHDWAKIACLRLAALLFRRRVDVELAPVSLKIAEEKIFTLDFAGDWLERHPLTAYTLEQEVAEWARVGISLVLQSHAEVEHA